ncbi:MAG: hypothetical protein ACOC1H_04440 [Desulfosalsimonas sp.]
MSFSATQCFIDAPCSDWFSFYGQKIIALFALICKKFFFSQIAAFVKQQPLFRANDLTTRRETPMIETETDMTRKARFPALQTNSELLKIAIISLYASPQVCRSVEAGRGFWKNVILNGG